MAVRFTRTCRVEDVRIPRVGHPHFSGFYLPRSQREVAGPPTVTRTCSRPPRCSERLTSGTAATTQSRVTLPSAISLRRSRAKPSTNLSTPEIQDQVAISLASCGRLNDRCSLSGSPWSNPP